MDCLWSCHWRAEDQGKANAKRNDDALEPRRKTRRDSEMEAQKKHIFVFLQVFVRPRISVSQATRRECIVEDSEREREKGESTLCCRRRRHHPKQTAQIEKEERAGITASTVDHRQTRSVSGHAWTGVRRGEKGNGERQCREEWKRELQRSVKLELRLSSATLAHSQMRP